MPVPACFHLVDDIFPRVRADAARRLAKDGWSQSRIAGALQVSQAMVSKYVGKEGDETDALVLRLTDDLLKDLQSTTPADGPGAWCHALSIGEGRPGADDALQDLLQAERAILQNAPLPLVPQIGLNIARATPDATAPDDVLSYPGRIIAAGDRLISPVPPAWGASNHLAAALLELRRHDPSAQAIANIRGGEDVVTAAESASVAPVQAQRQDAQDDDAVFSCFAAGNPVVHDPGAVGIEPCLYIAAPTAMDVVATIHSINERLTQ